MSLSQAVGAVKTIALKGKEYKIGELTLGDYADFEEHIRQTKAKRLVSCFKDLPGGSQKELYAALNEPVKESELEAEMATIGGARYMFYLALKKHQDITIEAVSELITLDNLPDLLPQIIGDHQSKNGGAPESR